MREGRGPRRARSIQYIAVISRSPLEATEEVGVEGREKLTVGIVGEARGTKGEVATAARGVTRVRREKGDLTRVEVRGVQANAGGHRVQGTQNDGGPHKGEVDTKPELNVALGLRRPRNVAAPECREQPLQCEFRPSRARALPYGGGHRLRERTRIVLILNYT